MQEIQKFSSQHDDLLAGGPRWLDFTLFAETMVEKAIQKNIYEMEKYNRYYSENNSIVNTHVILSIAWLWRDSEIRLGRDYAIGWQLVQKFLINKFAKYNLQFSKNAETEFCIDKFYYKEYIPHFWILIRSRNAKSLSKQDRMIGCFMGQAIGDALGADRKFSQPTSVPKQLQFGGGPFKLQPGQVGITELAIIIARSDYSIDKIKEKFSTWQTTNPPPFFKELGEMVLALVPPFAIHGKLQALYDFLPEIVQDKIIIDMAQVFAVSIRNVLDGDKPRDVWKKAILQATSKSVKDILYSATDTHGDTFIQGAFYELLHIDNFENALARVIALGEDTDARGAICGALIGAHIGFLAIPSNLSHTVLNVSHWRQKVFPDINTTDIISLALKGADQK